MKNKMLHPCNCKQYNGEQCYNCLNGAHNICVDKKKCKSKNSSHLGVKIICIK